jgi:glycosyltransferase involved in cell wall biosynthesis
MPSVAFLTRDFSPGTNPLQPGGCAWYRCYLPMMELQQHGWQVGMGIPDWDLGRGFGLRHTRDTTIAGWDVVVLKLLMDRETPHHVKQARKAGQIVIVDVDDFYAGLTPDNQAHLVTDPNFNPDRNRDHYERVIEAADVVITSTPFLRDWYTERHPNVHMVRNGIDTGRWYRQKDSAGWTPTLGWVGGIPWRSGDLETMREWMPQFVERHGLRLHHSGHLDGRGSLADKTGVPLEIVSTSPMCPILDYPNLFDGFQIGLVPLTDIPFNHAKSTIKGLEYAAAGIPFVAAASPEYVRLADLGIGRVASHPDDWIKHITDLLDPKVRKREAARQRALVSQEFSMTQRGREWDSLLRQVVTAP